MEELINVHPKNIVVNFNQRLVSIRSSSSISGVGKGLSWSLNVHLNMYTYIIRFITTYIIQCREKNTIIRIIDQRETIYRDTTKPTRVKVRNTPRTRSTDGL